MRVALTAEQERELREVLVEAFAPGDLAIVVRDHVREDLHNLTAPGTHRQQAFGLLQACRQRGWLDRLVFGVLAERGEDPRVIDLARRLGLHPAGPPGGLEKLVGPNLAMVDLHPWLARCSEAAARVCQVRVRGEKAGSGFLVGPDAVLTSYHVIAATLDQPGELAFVFDHARTASGDVHPGVAFAGAQRIAGSPPGSHRQWDEPEPAVAELGADELDFALVRLAEPAGALGIGGAAHGRPRGWIALSPAAHDFAAAPGLAILQHPLGDPVKLALDFADQGRPSRDGRRVRYTVPTEAGSSGSPVFHAETLTLVALHQGGRSRFNQGIPTQTIAAHAAVAAYLAEVPRP
jgi:Trypsin-like peptidase domain/Effector-associated domain 1